MLSHVDAVVVVVDEQSLWTATKSAPPNYTVTTKEGALVC